MKETVEPYHGGVRCKVLPRQPADEYFRDAALLEQALEAAAFVEGARRHAVRGGANLDLVLGGGGRQIRVQLSAERTAEAVVGPENANAAALRLLLVESSRALMTRSQ